MSATNANSATVESIKGFADLGYPCGCRAAKGPKRFHLCMYHQGFDDSFAYAYSAGYSDGYIAGGDQ